MDGVRFDSVTRGLTKNTSRRQVFGGLLGGAAAALTGAGVLEAAKGGNGKGKAKGKGKGKNKPKVSFCHRTGNGSYHLITVGGSKQKGHRKHGDQECPANICDGRAVGCTAVCTSTGACAPSV